MNRQTTQSSCPVCHCISAMSSIGVRGDGKKVKRCPHCGCGILDAELSLETIASFYSDSYFRIEHPAYFTDLQQQTVDPGNLANLLLDRLAKFVNLKGARFLDIGCAAGVLLATARNRGADVLGLEISESAAEMARKAFGLEVLTGRPQDHVLPNETFDIVCLIDVIEHVLTPRDDIQLISRILKKGGLICVLTPNLRARRVFGSHWHGFNASYEHILYFNRKSLMSLFKNFDLEPVLVETHGMVDLVQYYAPSISGRIPHKLRNFTNRLIAKLLRLAGAEHRLLMIARKL